MERGCLTTSLLLLIVSLGIVPSAWASLLLLIISLAFRKFFLTFLIIVFNYELWRSKCQRISQSTQATSWIWDQRKSLQPPAWRRNKCHPLLPFSIQWITKHLSLLVFKSPVLWTGKKPDLDWTEPEKTGLLVVVHHMLKEQPVVVAWIKNIFKTSLEQLGPI